MEKMRIPKIACAVACVVLAGSARAAVVARMEERNGAPTVVVNGCVIPPKSLTLASWTRTNVWRSCSDYLRKVGEAGIKVHYVDCTTRWHTPGDPSRGLPDGIEKARMAIRDVLAAIPDAYIMLRFNVSPPLEWVNAHPEEQFLFSDGSHHKVICTSVSGKCPVDGMHSLCSKTWMARADKAIEEFFGELEKMPEADRVIGTFLCAGGTSEWYYPHDLVSEDGKAWGDCSEPFRAYYEGFLRRKYGTVEELRRVWKRPDATFEHPLVPTAKEREFVYDSDEQILSALRRWESASREINGRGLNIDARKRESLGVFLNANEYAHVADFYAAWNESTAATIVHFARTLKRLSPNRLTGAFYGSYGNGNFFDSSTSTGTPLILDSGVVDFLAAPDVYNNRKPGCILAQREMQDSMRLHGMTYVCENDARTHLCKPWMQRDSMALYGVRDSIETLKRDFARDLCEDVRGWWFDMGPGWYDEPEILALFKRQQEIAREAYGRDRTKHNEIALVYDTESTHYASLKTSQLPLDFWRTTDLGRIGAPVDYYFHNDLANPKMPDYKLYVMMNQWYLTDEERETIYTKARRNGATVLWMYAPGFVNPKAGKTMDVANVEKTVGMRLGFLDRTFFPHFRVDPQSHPMLANVSPTRRYGIIDREIHSNIWIGPKITAQYLNPGFYIADAKATVLGRFCFNEEPALAMVETNGVRIVYCATLVMRSDLLAAIAEGAGCHVYSKDDDAIYANENYVAIHAATDGRKTIRFKRPCSPFELYEKRYYGRDVRSVEVDLQLGDTKMWRLDDVKDE